MSIISKLFLDRSALFQGYKEIHQNREAMTEQCKSGGQIDRFSSFQYCLHVCEIMVLTKHREGDKRLFHVNI